MTTLIGLRSEHLTTRNLIGRLHLVEAELLAGHVERARAGLADVLRDVDQRVFPAMHEEEVAVYPLLTRAVGSSVTALTLVAEHRDIRERVAGLQSRPGPEGVQDGASVPDPYLLAVDVRRLADRLELHLRREETAFGALVAARLAAVA